LHGSLNTIISQEQGGVKVLHGIRKELDHRSKWRHYDVNIVWSRSDVFNAVEVGDLKHLR